MEEKWRDIRGYEGLYQVSNLGRVRSLRDNHGKCREKILKACNYSHGYKYVNLYSEGVLKKFLIHRLVAETFIDNPNNYSQVNHRDENKSNNKLENLEWCTVKYNSNYGTRNIRRIRAQKGQSRSSISGSRHPKARKVQCITTGKKFNCIKEAAEYYYIDRRSISQCCKGKRKSGGKHPVTEEKLKWKYID